MEIILMQQVPGLGQQHDLVRVKKGYAQHYLIPRGFALVATKANHKINDEQKKQRDNSTLIIKEKAEELAKKVAHLQFTLKVEATPIGKIFGTISPLQIVEMLNAQGIKVAAKQITFPTPIEAIGQHPVLLTLHPEVKKTIQVSIKAKHPG